MLLTITTGRPTSRQASRGSTARRRITDAEAGRALRNATVILLVDLLDNCRADRGTSVDTSGHYLRSAEGQSTSPTLLRRKRSVQP